MERGKTLYYAPNCKFSNLQNFSPGFKAFTAKLDSVKILKNIDEAL